MLSNNGIICFAIKLWKTIRLGQLLLKHSKRNIDGGILHGKFKLSSDDSQFQLAKRIPKMEIFPCLFTKGTSDLENVH